MYPPNNNQWPPGGGYPQQPPPYQPRPKDPVDAVATRALILSVIAVPLCCAPVGIAGILFGAQAMKMAKARGSSSPGRAVAAVVLGGLSILLLVGAIIAFQLDQKARAERLAAAENATRGKLEEKTLDKPVACALVEKQLLKGLYRGETHVDHVSCGKWGTDEKFGRMKMVEAEVVGDKKVFDACFARARRWFVISVAEAGETCPTEPIEAKSGDASEAEYEAEEEELREGARARVDKATVAAFEASLIKVRKSVGDHEHGEKKCGPLDLGGPDKRVVSTVDFNYLKDTHSTKEDWSFLTSERVKHALEETRPLEERAKLVREVAGDGGHYLVTYVADARDWPEAIKPKGILAKKGFAAGGLDGWMIVVNTRDGSVVCESAFAFENSKSVAVGKWGGDKGVATALKDDLKKNYETAASDKLRAMTDGKLRLGFSPLD